MSEPYIIGLSGKAGAGKDTSFKLIKEIYEPRGYRVVQVAFATKLKKFAVRYFPMVDLNAKDFVTRNILQGIGEMFRGEVDTDYWVKGAIDSLPKGIGSETIVCITDVRHVNEANFIKNMPNGLMIRVTGREHDLSEEQRNHPSEVGLDDYHGFDFFIDNSGDLDSTRNLLERTLDEVFGG